MLFCFDTSFADALNISHKIKSPFPPKPKPTNHHTAKINSKNISQIPTFLCTLNCTVIFMSKHSYFFSCRKVIFKKPPYNKKSIFSYSKAENALSVSVYLHNVLLCPYYINTSIGFQTFLFVTSSHQTVFER